MKTIIILVILLCTIACICYILKKIINNERKQKILKKDILKLSLSGIIAFIGDTIGVGSFAINIAICKSLKLFEDEELPAVVNIAQVIPGTIEAVFFLKVVKVDPTTLVLLILATTIGGILGAICVSKIKSNLIKICMIFAFAVIAILLLLSLLNIIPVNGNLVALHGLKLDIAFIGLLICGFLTAFGVGLFVMVQVVLFLLGMAPIVAFPIMTTAGAVQQPLSAITFVRNIKTSLKKIMIISISGIIGVLIAIPVISNLSSYYLHWLLFVVTLYNLIVMSLSYINKHKKLKPILLINKPA